MGCQKNIAGTIVDKGAELFSQDCLKTGIKNPTVDSYETTDGDHGIIEVRRYFTTSDINWLQGKEAWKDINTIGMVQCERHIGGEISSKTSYYISNIKNDTKLFSHAVPATGE